MNGMELRVVVEEVILFPFDVDLFSHINGYDYRHHVKDIIGDEMSLQGLELGLEIQNSC